ncbi:unnamed protein product, partial [Thlaspi arvense]
LSGFSMFASGEGDPDFKWGVEKAVGRTDSKVHFYESFTYDGIEYRLFDCVCFQVLGQCETSIGKLIRMYETPAGEKKVKVLWFFRPVEIRRFLRGYEPLFDELFLACGDDVGVYNINGVDAIIGKCNVVCVSDDPRNPRPAKSELRNAQYIFSRTFDTRRKIISQDFADAIAGIRVEKFFNKVRANQPVKRLNSNAATGSRPSPVKSFRPESTRSGKNDNRDGKFTSRTSPTGLTLTFLLQDLFRKDLADQGHVKKYPPVSTDITSRGLKTKTRAFGSRLASGSSLDPRLSKRRRVNSPEIDYSGPESGEKRSIKNPPLVDKGPSQNIGKHSWFKKLPFEEELKEAIRMNRVLLIENLEPSLTSLEVEDVCRKAFNERVDAEMIPATLASNPDNGKALVIFQTTRAADNALSRLTEGCLMLSDERPLVGSRNVPKEVRECERFTGHLRMLGKPQMTIEKASCCNSHFCFYLNAPSSPRKPLSHCLRKAVATAHCAQPNHVVYEMAIEWLALQGKSELECKRLFEEQAKEMNILWSKDPKKTRG